MSTDIVKFTPMNLDDLDAQEKQIGFDRGGGQFYQFKDGRNTVRILPGVHGRQPFIQFWKHFVKASADGKAWGGACPAKMAKLPCPVDQVAAKLSRGSDADRIMADDLTARRRILCNLLDRSAPDLGPQVAEIGPSIYDAVKDFMRTMGEDPTNPGEAGFDLVIEKSGSGMKTEYKTVAVRKNSPLHTDARQLNEWLQSAVDLGGYATVLAEHEIVSRLGGTIIAGLLGGRGSKPAGKAARASDAVGVDSDDDAAY
jgi:hypothetical protein